MTQIILEFECDEANLELKCESLQKYITYKYFQWFLVTIVCNLKIYLIMSEPHQGTFIFMKLLHSQAFYICECQICQHVKCQNEAAKILTTGLWNNAFPFSQHPETVSFVSIINAVKLSTTTIRPPTTPGLFTHYRSIHHLPPPITQNPNSPLIPTLSHPYTSRLPTL